MPKIVQSNGPDVTSPDSDVERLAREVAVLRAENAQHRASLEAELEAVRAQVTGQRASPASDDSVGRHDQSPKRRLTRRRHNGSEGPDEPSSLVSRRRLFGLLGGAAAVGTGLAVTGSTLTADSAGAVDGGSLLIGTANTATSGSSNATQLTGSTSAQLMQLTQNTSGQTALNVNTTGAGIAIQGTSPSGSGLIGNSGTGTGVTGGSSGSGTDASGVLGLSGSSVAAAVQGTSSATGPGAGVRGKSTNGAGLVGDGTFGATLIGTFAQLALFPNTGSSPPATGSAGMLCAVGPSPLSAADLFYCAVTSGTAAVWVKLSSPLVTIPPARVYDSRVGQLPATGPKSPITNGNTVSVDVTGTQAAGGPSGVPTGAKSVLGNITVINGPNPVFLTVFAQGATPPATSNINANGGQVIANNFTSQIGASNGISIKCGGGPTDFIIDIVGYYP